MTRYVVSYQSVGCLPDSDFWPCEFDSFGEAKDFLFDELTHETSMLDVDEDYDEIVEWEDSPGFVAAMGELDALTEDGGRVNDPNCGLYGLYYYSIERV